MRIIRLAEVMSRTGLGRSTIYKLMSEDLFPRSVELMPRTVGWVETEVEEWILERIARRDG